MVIYSNEKRASIIRAYFDGKLEIFERLHDGRWFAWKSQQTMSEEAILMLKPDRYEIEACDY